MPYLFDAGAQSLLKASATATATESNSVGYGLDECPTFAVVINVTEIKTSAADETYVFSVASLDAAGSNDVVQGALITVSEAGQYVIAVDGQTAKKLAGESDAQVKLTATISGTSPSITYGAQIHRAL